MVKLSLISMFALVCLRTVSQAEEVPLSDTVTQLTNQLMSLQFYLEEKVRSDGSSGIKQMRLHKGGVESYKNPSHCGNHLAGMHTHANTNDTIGFGEFDCVMYGVNFRTRHNDYKLVQPSTSSKDFHATEPIEPPPVPPEVLALEGVAEQVEEMKQWFKAFKEQNYTVRDYRLYFKPILCYLEAGWTTQTKGIQEPFASDRHQIDATSWDDLMEKIRYTSYSGSKDTLENYAYLPTTIWKIENGRPVFAQWNYRMLCHKLKNDLPLNRFHLINDLASIMLKDESFHEYSVSRAARFQLCRQDSDECDLGQGIGGLLDQLMQQIPGSDNYPANLTDNAFGEIASEYDTGNTLNVGYFHRYYKATAGASGRSFRHRGFSDPAIFMAMNSRPEIVETCMGQICQRWTYAIPIEVIYITPLMNWNPYKLIHKGHSNSPEGQTVRANKRNGSQTIQEKAYNGTNHRTLYRIPAEFYSSYENVDPADTSSELVGVLDPDEKIKIVAASGIRNEHFISGVGYVRQRYPIMPIHGEGSTVWKQTDALKDMLILPNKNFLNFPAYRDTKFVFLPKKNLKKQHAHHVNISGTNIKMLINDPNAELHVTTGEGNGHTHDIVLKYNATRGNPLKRIQAILCDGEPKFRHLEALIPREDFIKPMQPPL